MAEDPKQLNKEVDDQLEYLFAESDIEGAGTETADRNDPLRELKAIFLAVDWEINDDIMTAMLRQIETLKQAYEDDRIMTLFLQLLQAVGKYIKVQKANAHPDAVKLLHSIYTSLEIVSMSEGMTLAERKRILRAEVKRFQGLKETLARKKAQEPVETNTGRTPSKPPAEEIPAALRYVLDEVRRTIRSEFELLRKELRS